MSRKTRFLFLSVLLFFARSKSFSQVWELKYYGIEQGLPSSTVYQTLQDKQGFIWVATSKGIAKFDGYSFKTFSQSEGLPHNDSWNLFEDSKSRIWISMSGSTFTYIQDDKVYTVDNIQQKKEISYFKSNHYRYCFGRR